MIITGRVMLRRFINFFSFEYWPLVVWKNNTWIVRPIGFDFLVQISLDFLYLAQILNYAVSQIILHWRHCKTLKIIILARSVRKDLVVHFLSRCRLIYERLLWSIKLFEWFLWLQLIVWHTVVTGWRNFGHWYTRWSFLIKTIFWYLCLVTDYQLLGIVFVYCIL